MKEDCSSQLDSYANVPTNYLEELVNISRTFTNKRKKKPSDLIIFPFSDQQQNTQTSSELSSSSSHSSTSSVVQDSRHVGPQDSPQSSFSRSIPVPQSQNRAPLKHQHRKSSLYEPSATAIKAKLPLRSLLAAPRVTAGYMLKLSVADSIPSSPTSFLSHRKNHLKDFLKSSRRFVVLSHSLLYLFRSSQDKNATALSVLPISSRTIACVSETGMWALKVESPCATPNGTIIKTWYLQSPGKKEMLLWLSALKSTISHAKFAVVDLPPSPLTPMSATPTLESPMLLHEQLALQRSHSLSPHLESMRPHRHLTDSPVLSKPSPRLTMDRTNKNDVYTEVGRKLAKSDP